MDPVRQYFEHEYDASGTDSIGGECVTIPECTAGTNWHSETFQCLYREACKDRETYDPEQERCVWNAQLCTYPLYDLYDDCIADCT